MSEPSTPASSQSYDVVIIGAGLAGLSCALHLEKAGMSYVLCEASERIGGRVATDLVDGYRLDRGFQVLLTAYPEVQRWLDDSALDLRAFYPGALVRVNGAWHRVADPLRHPIDAMLGAFHPIGSLLDKMRIAISRINGFQLSRHGRELSTIAALHAEGYSDAIVEGFFRPFLGGVFLENQLLTSVEKMDFVMNYFSQGATAVPAKGMAEIPKQIASQLPASVIRLNCRVEHIDDNRVSLATGEMLQARAIVIATEAGSLSAKSTSETRPVFHRASCLYFSADQAPIDEPILLLNGDGKGPINHLAVMSCVSPEYAPAGKHLISVNVVDQDAALDADLIDKVQTQLLDWFGDAARTWQLLRHDRIERAIPQQHVIPQASVRFKPGLYQCGDHLGIASINTAMMTGREAAEAIIEDFKNC